MVGLSRTSNAQYALQDVIARGIVGDFLEAGVWRGGTCILARAVFAAYGEPRTVWVADSFAGLPVRGCLTVAAHSVQFCVRIHVSQHMCACINVCIRLYV